MHVWTYTGLGTVHFIRIEEKEKHLQIQVWRPIAGLGDENMIFEREKGMGREYWQLE